MLIDLVYTLKSKLEHYAKESGNEQLQANLEYELKSLRAKVGFTQNKTLIKKVYDNG